MSPPRTLLGDPAAAPPSPAVPASPAPAAPRTRIGRAEWQLRLLPMMIAVLVTASVAFLGFSLVQTNYVRDRIADAPTLELGPALTAISCEADGMSVAERQACARWKVTLVLETYVVQRRYHQANVSLLVRAWIKYLGFLTGMMIGVVGAVFILGRLTEAASQLAAEGTFGKLTIETVSPGLILVTLGTVLMITTVLVNPPTGVSDAPVYLSPPPAPAGGPGGG